MFHNIYLFSVLLATILGWASWLVVINKLSPFVSGNLALGLFYVSLFMALTGTFTLLNHYLRACFYKCTPNNHHLAIVLRQGIFISLLICVTLLFQRLRVLTWWDGLLLLGVFLLAESYFMSRD